MRASVVKLWLSPSQDFDEAFYRYRGVSTHKQSGKWVAQIKSGGKQVYLGFYADQVDAARAYDQAVIHMQANLSTLELSNSCKA